MLLCMTPCDDAEQCVHSCPDIRSYKLFLHAALPSFPFTPFLAAACWLREVPSKQRAAQEAATERSQNVNSGTAGIPRPGGHRLSTRNNDVFRNTQVFSLFIKDVWWTPHCYAAVPLPFVIKYHPRLIAPWQIQAYRSPYSTRNFMYYQL